MHVLIWPSPYKLVVPAKLQDLRPSPSFTKSSMDFHMTLLKKLDMFCPSVLQFFFFKAAAMFW